MIIRILCIGLMWAASTAAFACTDDSGCAAPARCHFRTGNPTGVCLDSSQMPIERTEAKRLSTRLQDRRTGDTCQFDVDCAARVACFKRPGAAEGKCAEPPR